MVMVANIVYSTFMNATNPENVDKLGKNKQSESGQPGHKVYQGDDDIEKDDF